MDRKIIVEMFIKTLEKNIASSDEGLKIQEE